MSLQDFRNEAVKKGFSEEEIDSFLVNKGVEDKQSPFVGFVKGALKGVGSTAFGAGKLGQEIGKAILPKPLERPLLGEDLEKPEFLEPRGLAEKAGFTTEQIAEFAIPGAKIVKAGKAAKALAGGKTAGTLAQAGVEAAGFGGIGSLQEGEPDVATGVIAGMIPIVASVGKPLISGVGKNVSNFFFGPEGTAGFVARYKDPQGVEKFLTTARRQPGGQNVEDIVTVLHKSIKKVTDKMVGNFRQAEETIVQKPIKSKPIVESAAKSIKDFLKIDKVSTANIKKSALSDTEANTVNKVVNLVQQNKDWTTKGVLQLRRKIGTFYRGSEASAKSDAIVTRLGKVLNSAIEEADPTFRAAAKTFSKDKNFLEKLGVNITGQSELNVDQAANKLFQLAKDLDNPFKREASESLLRQLGSRTGIDFISILRALKTAENLSPQKALGLRAGVMREIVRALQVGVSEVAGAAGKVARRLPQDVPTVGRGALFEGLQ